MGRRSRKRGVTRTPVGRHVKVPAVSAPPRAPTWRAQMDEAPKAAWSPFPLTELAILLSIVLIIVGFVTAGDRRTVLLAGGFTVVTLAAGELAIREHFAGFRSHSALLAAIAAIVCALPLWFAGVPQEVILVAALVVFGVAFVTMRRAFIRRSGGVGFRA